GYPIVCLPALLTALPTQKLKQYLVTLGAAIMAFLLPFILLNPAGMLWAVNYHQERPIQLESSPAAAGFVLQAAGKPIREVYSHFSASVEFPSAPIVTKVAALLLVFAFIAYFARLYFWRDSKHIA